MTSEVYVTRKPAKIRARPATYGEFRKEITADCPYLLSGDTPGYICEPLSPVGFKTWLNEKDFAELWEKEQ